jgi:hypothetical protein
MLDVPSLVVCAVCVGQPVPEETLIVRLIYVVSLQPHARNVDCVAVRWEATVSLVDVGADVGGAVDDVGCIVAGLLEVSRAEAALIDAVEERLVGIDAVGGRTSASQRRAPHCALCRSAVGKPP